MELMDQIATNAADYAVERYRGDLPKGRRLKIWKMHYDSVLAALMTFEEVDNARRVRARAYVSEN